MEHLFLSLAEIQREVPISVIVDKLFVKGRCAERVKADLFEVHFGVVFDVARNEKRKVAQINKPIVKELDLVLNNGKFDRL